MTAPHLDRFRSFLASAPAGLKEHFPHNSGMQQSSRMARKDGRGWKPCVPRNGVAVAPRTFPPLPRHRRERQRTLAELSERHRPTPHGHGNWLAVDFSKRKDPSVARAEVVAWLEEINRDWHRYVKLFPRVQVAQGTFPRARTSQ